MPATQYETPTFFNMLVKRQLHYFPKLDSVMGYISLAVKFSLDSNWFMVIQIHDSRSD